MKNVVFTLLGVALAAVAGYEVGKANGNTLKEKTIAAGMNLCEKAKELAAKVFPKKEEAPTTGEPASEE